MNNFIRKIRIELNFFKSKIEFIINESFKRRNDEIIDFRISEFQMTPG